MILRRSPFVAFAALALAACATTPVPAPRQAADAFAVASAATPQFSAQRLSDHIKYLASDEMEGRFPGLVGERLTLAYLQAQYEAMGLEPGGRDGSWLQPVDLVRFTPERAPTAAWTGVDGARHVLTSGTDITLRAGAADPVVRIAGAPLVFAGYGISGPTWDDYGAADLTGKVVVVLRGQPASMGADPNFYGSTTHKMQEALKRGAVGVITLQDQDGRWRRAVGGAARPQMTIKGAQDARFTGSINLAAATAIGGPALEAALA
ncbi:PA domain-containing protein, partial [Brevundimonas sp.]